MTSLEDISDKIEFYECIKNEYDSYYKDTLRAVEIVKKFIKDKKLIIYGGTAIDYALRLKGSHIYEENKLPDLDFISYNSIEHSFELADTLYDHGYIDCRAITGLFVYIQKIDIGRNNWVADISYKTKDFFDKIPTLKYNGLLIVHPIYQRIDIHSSLSFPFDDPPKEVIFSRWKKDIKRFNLLNDFYPIVLNDREIKMKKYRIPLIKKYVFTGMFIYSVLNNTYKITDDYIEFENFDSINEIEMVSMDIVEAAEYLKLEKVSYYENYNKILSKRCEGFLNGMKYIIYSTKDRLISFKELDRGVRMTTVQYLLMLLISYYIINKNEDLLYIYNETQKIILENKTSLVHLSIDVYGFKNNNLAKKIMTNTINHELYNESIILKPNNYYPHKTNKVHPASDIDSFPIYKQSGKKIDKQNSK